MEFFLRRAQADTILQRRFGMNRFTTLCALVLALGTAIAADQKPRPAQIEQMAPDQFSDVHAPLFRPTKSNDAGAMTESISPSNKSAPAISTPVALRNL